MKTIVWGCSQRNINIINKFAMNLIDVDFTDSDKSKWNQENGLGKKIIPLEEVNWSQYEHVIVGSERYEKEIEDMCSQCGVNKCKIIPASYIEGIYMRWKKEAYLEEWVKRIENKNIKIVKNWYVVDSRKECIVQITDLCWSTLKLHILGLGIDKVEFKIVNLSNGEEVIKTIGSTSEIVYGINEDNVILKFVIEDIKGAIPWITFDVMEKEKKITIKDEIRYENFRKFLKSMQRFYFHDEDYLALRNIDAYGTILDIGANYGQSMYAFYKLTSSKIVSVEVVPELYSVLEKYKSSFDEQNRVTIVNSGISDEETSLIWYEPNAKHISGSFDKTFIESRKLNVEITEKILECKTIDELFCNIDDIWFIKIDVEGLEYKAILGGLETIKKNYPIMLIEENMQKDNIYNLLKEYYDIYYYNPDKDIFVKEKVSGINYWLIPKKDYRKVEIRNIAE